MALKIDFAYEYVLVANKPYGDETVGVETGVLKDAYVKVDTVSGSKEQQKIAVIISQGENEFVKHYSFTPDLKGTNFIKQAYEHLKTLPEFEGAVDC